MLRQNLLEKVMDYIMSHGGDFAEIYGEYNIHNQIIMSGSKISETSSGTDAGVGIRILCGTQCSYLYSGDEREESLLKLLKENWKKNKTSKQSWQPWNISQNAYHHMDNSYRSASVKEKVALMERCDKAGLAYNSAISQMRFKYLDMDQRIQVANSEGLYVEDSRQKTRMYIEAVARRNGEVECSYYGPGAMRGFEFYDSIDVEQCARDTAAAAIRHLGSKPCPTGRMPVIIARGFGGLLFHEACGHSLEANSIIGGESEFAGCLGEQVASPKVTLIDDGSISDGWGSGHIDDEGEPTRKNVLIENGILKNFLVDRVNGQKLGLKANGSSRRENYRFAPTSRMSNTYIAPGNDSVEQMIASVEKGIYVKNINAGSVNPITGEFNFNTGDTYLIEHGEITVPVHSATLIGTGRDVLDKVEQVGSDLKMSQGFCYAGSGALYVGVGQPTVKVSEITVGGMAC